MWLEIFAGGKQSDSAGKEHDGDWLIQRAIDTFDVTKHEPPVVIGHPRHDAPAYGWVKELKAAGGKLLARIEEFAPALVSAINGGSYKKRSASFYADGRLRHVGFLGASPPAVKGLADVAFAEGDFISFEGEKNMTVEELQGRVAELEAAQRMLKAQAEEDKQRALAELEAKFQEVQAAEKRQTAQDATRQWVDGKVNAGVIPPAVASGLGDFMASLEPDLVFEFAEGGNKTQKNAVAYMKGLIETLFEKQPFASLFSEVATKDTAGAQSEAQQDEELGKRIAAAVNVKGGK